MALQLLIDGVDHISELVHGSLRVDQTNDGLNSTCQFDIRDAGVVEKDAWTVGVTRVEDGDVITGHTAFSEPKVEVSVVDGATVYFSGVLSRIGLAPSGLVQLDSYLMPTEQILRCYCHGFNMMLEESVIDTLEEYKNKTDEFVIDDLFTNYVTGIDFATHVDGGVHTFISIFFENMTIRQAMNHIVGRTGYIWYVDYSKKLHYSAAEANAPAWHLSDVPDQVNSFSYFDPVAREVDATNLVNMVFFVHSEGADWFTDEASRAKYDDHKFILRDARFSIPESIEGRANALLDKFANPVITYTVKTYKDDLRAGMHVRFVCAYLDVDEELLINSLQVTFPVDGEPVYELTLGGLESSIGGSARRLGLDHWQDPSPIAPGQLPLASRGWGHDLVFSATDDDTVAWEAGTLTTASGQDFAIGAGNTDDPGAMTEKTIVYLDLVEDPTAPHDLQMTTDETAALGAMKIMVAVCWPGIVAAGAQPEVKAGFQIFGATGELATFLNATNIIANAITANEIYCNTLSAIVADMGVLTAGEIRMYANTWDVDADGFRLLAAEIAGQLDGVDQIVLSGTDGKLYAGAGAVILDEDGLRMVGAGATGNTRILRFLYDDAGNDRAMGQVYSDWGGGANPMLTWVTALRLAGVPWPTNVAVVLQAYDTIADPDKDVRLYVQSDGIVSVSGSIRFECNADLLVGADAKVTDDLRVLKGLYVGGDVDPDEDDAWVAKDVRIGGGLYVGQTGVDPPADDIFVDGDIRIGKGLYVGTLAVAPGDNDIQAQGKLISGDDIWAQTKIIFANVTYYLHRSGENLVWHNATGDHVVQVA